MEIYSIKNLDEVGDLWRVVIGERRFVEALNADFGLGDMQVAKLTFDDGPAVVDGVEQEYHNFSYEVGVGECLRPYIQIYQGDDAEEATKHWLKCIAEYTNFIAPLDEVHLLDEEQFMELVETGYGDLPVDQIDVYETAITIADHLKNLWGPGSKREEVGIEYIKFDFDHTKRQWSAEFSYRNNGRMEITIKSQARTDPIAYMGKVINLDLDEVERRITEDLTKEDNNG